MGPIYSPYSMMSPTPILCFANISIVHYDAFTQCLQTGEETGKRKKGPLLTVVTDKRPKLAPFVELRISSSLLPSETRYKQRAVKKLARLIVFITVVVLSVNSV